MFFRVFVLIFLTHVSFTFAVDPSPWMRHPEKAAPHEDVWGSIITFYWTFDPDNADQGWDEWTLGEAPQDPVHLRGTDITVPRNMAEKYNLEGSGWYTADGGHRVVNIIQPHVEPESTLFKEVPFVDYGLDAPHYHFGLVPFRSVAGVHDDIPAGTWVYIPMFDGLQLPVYDVDDRTQLDYTFWHDGWFRVTDISWSFADDETQIDIFTGTVQATSELYNQIWYNFEQTGIWNETKQEYQYLDTYQGNISFYFKSDVPLYASSAGDPVYRYAKTVDTVHNDTKAHEYHVPISLSNEEQIIATDLDGDSYRDDVIVINRSTRTITGFSDFDKSGSTQQWSTVFTEGEIYDIEIADLFNAGEESIVLVTSSGVYGAKEVSSTPQFQKLSSDIFEMVLRADTDNNDKNEIVGFRNGEFFSCELTSLGAASFSAMNIQTSGNVTAIAAGDITAEGQDELFWANENGIFLRNLAGSSDEAFSDELTSVESMEVGYIDPDGYADLYAVTNGEVKAKYSSHKLSAPFVTIGETNSHWISIGNIDPRGVEDLPVSVSENSFRKQQSFFSVTNQELFVSDQLKELKLSVYSLSGRKVMEISGVKKGEGTMFSLKSLEAMSVQPLLLVVQGTRQVHKQLWIK